MSSYLVRAAALAVLLLAACQPRPYEFHGSPYPSPPEAPPANLLNVTGESFHLSDYRGSPVLLYFGYTHCPDLCPATLHNMAWVFDQLGNQAADVQFVFVTTDPDRDTPDVLRRYLDAFDPRFIGLYADLASIQEAARAYGVFLAKEPPTDQGYLVSHTARVFLIDPQGVLRTNYPVETPREEILADLRYLLSDAES